MNALQKRLKEYQDGAAFPSYQELMAIATAQAGQEPVAWRVHKKAKGEPLTLGYDGPALFQDRAWAESWMHEQIDFKGFTGAWIENLYAGPDPVSALVLAAIHGVAPLVEPVYICKALRAGQQAHVVLDGGNGPKAAVHLVNIGLTGWIHTAETAEAFSNGYNLALKQFRAALLETVEQPPAAQPAQDDSSGRVTQAKDAARWRIVRDIPDDQLGVPGVLCVSMPTAAEPSQENGYHANGEDADRLADAAIAAQSAQDNGAKP
jgi:hypothetical protein